jgi:hypothetical protein
MPGLGPPDRGGRRQDRVVDLALRARRTEGEYDDSRVVDTVRALTGRAPGRFADWARALAGAFA